MLVALLSGGLLPATGVAQEAGEPLPPKPDGEGTFQQVGRLDVPEGVTSTPDLVIWPEGRRGYLVAGGTESYYDPTDEHARSLVAVNLDTFEEVARSDPEETPHVDSMLPGGNHDAVAVDRASGRIYVAHNDLSQLTLSGGTGDEGGPTTDDDATRARCADVRGEATSSTEDAAANLLFPAQRANCFAGVYVLDGHTLDRVDAIRFNPTGLDDPSIRLALGSMRFSSPRGPGDTSKLHLLLYEATHRGPGERSQEVSMSTWHRTNRQYAAQIDVASGETDWIVAVSGCTGGPDERFNGGIEQLPFGRAQVFRGPDRDRPVVWVGCWGSGIGQAAIVRIDLEESDSGSSVAGQEQFLAPPSALTMRSDPASERLLVKTSRNSTALWWLFDGHAGGFIARVDIGPFNAGNSGDAIGPDSGRLYTFAHDKRGETAATSHAGGLGFTDTRRQQLAQYIWDHSKSDLEPTEVSGTQDPNNQALPIRMAVEPATDGRNRRMYFRHSSAQDHFVVLEDPTPVAIEPLAGNGGSRSDDVPEQEGVTTTTYSGSARGYGLHTVLLGGVEAAAGLYPGEGVQGSAYAAALHAPCNGPNREAAFAVAGPPDPNQQALIDQTGTAAATARPALFDSRTRRDAEAPYSRCRTRDNLLVGDLPEWPVGLLPVREGDDSEPDLDERLPTSEEVSCFAPDRPSDETGDDVFRGFHAEVACERGRIMGASRARIGVLGPVAVASAGSDYEVRRRADGGIVSEVVSWARGVSVVGEHGAVHIDGIRAEVTAWATGRSQPEDAASDPNCDMSRTAGSCYRRWFSGVRITDADGQVLFSCDPCADNENQQRMVAGIQQALGSGYIVSAPDPDPRTASGARDGFQVVVAKPPVLAFADETMKGDLLPTLPALEIVRVTDARQNKGRQTFQFAGVETGLTYGIICLKSIIDGQCQSAPASLTINLTDVDGTPLEGGLFQVQPDPDGDGEIGLDETLEESLACTTGPDGTCGFDSIPAGTYVVHQSTAPPGFLPAPDTPINLPEGAQAQLDIVNGTPSVTGIAISLHDRSSPPQPLEGAEFEVHTDTDLAGQPLATCTTNANGVCEFEVPAAGGIDPVTSVVGQDITHVLQVPPGPYVIHQASTPDGYEPLDDIAFGLPAGQIARVGLTNGPVVAAGDDVAAAPEPVTPASDDTSAPASTSTGEPQEPVRLEEPRTVPQPQITINVPQPAPEPATQVAGSEGDTFNVFQNPAQAAKLLLRDPKEAASFGAAWLLFGAAVAGAWRRRMILAQFDA